MKSLYIALFLALGISIGYSEAGGGKLENENVAWRWRLVGERLQPFQLSDKLNGVNLELTGECFCLTLRDGTVLKASDFKQDGPPVEEALQPEPDSPTLARHSAGRQVTIRLSAPERNLSAVWRAILRDGSSYVRTELALRATGKDVFVKEVVLFEQKVPGAKTVGSVDGSPVVTDTLFIGYEHPMAHNKTSSKGVACSFLRSAELKDGETLTQSCVIGVVPRGQMRRGFLSYIERERAHPYRPFLHYNSWFDIAWDTRKFNEAESLDAINQFGRELVQNRGVQMQSFLFDDGWDNNHTLWKFHDGFPNGFTPLTAAAAKLHASIGVWLSPFGGYNNAKVQRLKFGSEQGFETNASGFALSGPKYYERFHEICLEMVQKYGVNLFKFDGLAASAKADASGGSATRDGDAMLHLIADLRTANPDIYISQTTGTWPSPFWLLYVDSIWRGGADKSFTGKGSSRQQWITYRDMDTYQSVVKRGPLYPLNSLMLHGVICATNAEKLNQHDDGEFSEEVHSFFGNGTQLQELYVTPKLLDERNWDDIAESANWSRSHADVLVDTHWVGGDPGKDEVYGWASWSPKGGILVLRNPDDKPAKFTGDVAELFDLPANAPKSFQLHSPWKQDGAKPVITASAGTPVKFTLQPFEVLVLESK